MKKTIGLLFILLPIILFAINPTKEYIVKPSDYTNKYSIEKIKTTDNYQLEAWLFYPDSIKNKHTSIIISNGDAGNMSYFAYFASELSRSGYTVIAYDYRGFGNSDSFNIQHNFLYYDEFLLDLNAVIAYEKIAVKSTKIGLYGFSMGTINSILSTQNNKIDFLILEGAVFNPIAYVQHLDTLKKINLILPSNAEFVQNLFNQNKLPTLIFNGLKDVYIQNIDCKNYVRKSKNRKLIVFKGGHGDGMQILTKKSYADNYIQIMDKFLLKNVR